jgi:DNA-binding IclR family transcriptional regulator
VEELAKGTGLSAATVADALTYLDTRDLAAADAADRWDLVVPLMRRWMRLRS